MNTNGQFPKTVTRDYNNKIRPHRDSIVYAVWLYRSLYLCADAVLVKSTATN